MDYKDVLEQQVETLEKAQKKMLNENKEFHPPFICEVSKAILEIVQELRCHNY